MNFQIFKLDLEKVEEPEIKLPTSVASSKKQDSCSKISTSALLKVPKPLTVWITRNWKILVLITIPSKGNAKEHSNYHTIALISHTSKELIKILQARLQQYLNHELPDVQAGFRKDRGTRDQIANICWVIERAREFQKNIYFSFHFFLKLRNWSTYSHRVRWRARSATGKMYVTLDPTR